MKNTKTLIEMYIDVCLKKVEFIEQFLPPKASSSMCFEMLFCERVILGVCKEGRLSLHTDMLGIA